MSNVNITKQWFETVGAPRCLLGFFGVQSGFCITSVIADQAKMATPTGGRCN
jgi:hypothetical protein